jgi:hypothetical protein
VLAIGGAFWGEDVGYLIVGQGVGLRHLGGLEGGSWELVGRSCEVEESLPAIRNVGRVAIRNGLARHMTGN